jgi:hypothetical protein
MKKIVKLTESDIENIVKKTISEQNFDVDRYEETYEEGRGQLLKYLEFLEVKGVLEKGMVDEIMGLADSYADDMWREGAQGGFYR